MQRHEDQPLRVATIGIGIAVGVVSVPAYTFDYAFDSDFGMDAEKVAEVILFSVPLVWFFCNALRWLQVRLIRPEGWVLFATIAVLVGVGGIALANDAAKEFSRLHDWNRAAGGFANAGSLLALTVALAISAVWFLLAQPTHGGHWLGGPTPSSGRPANLDARSDSWLRVGRWLAIAGGVMFVLSIPVSPTVIPAAIALTCLVRYIATMSANNHIRLASAIGVAALLVAIQVDYAFGLSPANAPLGWIGATSTMAMIAALVISFFNRPAHTVTKSTAVTT